jgi:hypothetical protein
VAAQKSADLTARRKPEACCVVKSMSVYPVRVQRYVAEGDSA